VNQSLTPPFGGKDRALANIEDQALQDLSVPHDHAGGLRYLEWFLGRVKKSNGTLTTDKATLKTVAKVLDALWLPISTLGAALIRCGASQPDATKFVLLLLPHWSGYSSTTDLGNARRLVRFHGRDLRYCANVGWFVWDGSRWKKDETNQVMRLAKQTIGTWRDDARGRLLDTGLGHGRRQAI
jgi:hypothetical protein